MTSQDTGPERLRDAADEAPVLYFPDVTVEWHWQGPDQYDRITGRRADWMPEDAPTWTVFYSGSGEPMDHWPPPVGWKIRYSDGRTGHPAQNATLVEVLRLVPRDYWGWVLEQHQGLRVFLQNKVQWEIGRVADRKGNDGSDSQEVTAKHIGGAAMDLFRLAREFAEAQDFQAQNQPPPYFKATGTPGMTFGATAAGGAGGTTFTFTNGAAINNGETMRALLEALEMSGTYFNGEQWACCPLCQATAPRTHGHGRVKQADVRFASGSGQEKSWADGAPCPLGIALGRNAADGSVLPQEEPPEEDAAPKKADLPEHQMWVRDLDTEGKTRLALSAANLHIVRPPQMDPNGDWRIDVEPVEFGYPMFHCVGKSLDLALLNVLGQLSASGYPLDPDAG
jgi:hypothetical protein